MASMNPSLPDRENIDRLEAPSSEIPSKDIQKASKWCGRMARKLNAKPGIMEWLSIFFVNPQKIAEEAAGRLTHLFEVKEKYTPKELEVLKAAFEQLHEKIKDKMGVTPDKETEIHLAKIQDNLQRVELRHKAESLLQEIREFNKKSPLLTLEELQTKRADYSSRYAELKGVSADTHTLVAFRSIQDHLASINQTIALLPLIKNAKDLNSRLEALNKKDVKESYSLQLLVDSRQRCSEVYRAIQNDLESSSNHEVMKLRDKISMNFRGIDEEIAKKQEDAQASPAASAPPHTTEFEIKMARLQRLNDALQQLRQHVGSKEVDLPKEYERALLYYKTFEPFFEQYSKKEGVGLSEIRGNIQEELEFIKRALRTDSETKENLEPVEGATRTDEEVFDSKVLGSDYPLVVEAKRKLDEVLGQISSSTNVTILRIRFKTCQQLYDKLEKQLTSNLDKSSNEYHDTVPKLLSGLKQKLDAIGSIVAKVEEENRIAEEKVIEEGIKSGKQFLEVLKGSVKALEEKKKPFTGEELEQLNSSHELNLLAFKSIERKLEKSKEGSVALLLADLRKEVAKFETLTNEGKPER